MTLQRSSAEKRFHFELMSVTFHDFSSTVQGIIVLHATEITVDHVSCRATRSRGMSDAFSSPFQLL